MRIFVEKKKEFCTHSKSLQKDILESLQIKLENVSIYNRYDVFDINEQEFKKSSKVVFSEANVDDVHFEKIELDENKTYVCVKYLDGQYDQRADFAEQSVEILCGKKPVVKTAKVYSFNNIDEESLAKVKKFLINTIDSEECDLFNVLDNTFDTNSYKPVEIIENFTNFTSEELQNFLDQNSLAMTILDLTHIRDYFVTQKRNPTITEIKVLDTYWSDHCRHTTFMTKLKNVVIEDGKYNDLINKSYEMYLTSRKNIDSKKDITLMDIAVICMKELRLNNKLEDLDVSEEINACSINVIVDKIDFNGVETKEEYLLMFKNETHNHPTEIEPFGGAQTCLGGAIRDPLSGRSYVYQAMRVSGSANPLNKETLEGKLSQKKITTGASSGYSSYGNQIGLSTGLVSEVYHEDFVAKRMEVGAVIAATKKENVVREVPMPGDVVILVGGKTGRDGCGGATGSSKEHDENSIKECGSEVQKGDAPTERKIQRLFRNSIVSKMIKRCNDFGAGGVSVAIGELADSLDIYLHRVPLKYEGLNQTEIAISESQERMAVVLDKSNLEKFIELSNKENLEATHVADITDSGYMRMYYNGEVCVNLERDFIETNGVTGENEVLVSSNNEEFNMNLFSENDKTNFDKINSVMKNLNVCSQKGLLQKFDSSIGASSVLMPFGGKYQQTPSQSMVCKIPVECETKTASVMSYGYNPYIAKWSPFYGAYYAVIDSICKVVASGCDYKKTRLSLQEYFEKLGTDKEKWGKPFSALLGAYYVQNELEIPAIGGKDSMSGTFKDISVPPTLVSFSVNTINTDDVISSELKKTNSNLYLIKTNRLEDYSLDMNELKKNFEFIYQNNSNILSTYSIGAGGIVEAICKMSFGNKIGVDLNDTNVDLYDAIYGSFLVETTETYDFENAILLGNTTESYELKVKDETINLEMIYESFSGVLEEIFPTKVEKADRKVQNVSFVNTNKKTSNIKIAKPKVFIPTFPGTNSEYDLEKAFLKAGGDPHIEVFKNLKANDIDSSIEEIAKRIKESQILMLPGGFSAGDEPDGSAKFIKAVFSNEQITEAIEVFLDKNDGLILGICNGFQALIKLGLLPYGKITETTENCPTLTYNDINRHQSQVIRTKITSNKSPWLYETNVGDIHSMAISHGEGKFIASDEMMKKLIENGQIATQYVDFDGNASSDILFNPNGSYNAVEGITSECGKIFGKMGHSERIGNNVMKNIYGEKDQKIFESGIKYFK